MAKISECKVMFFLNKRKHPHENFCFRNKFLLEWWNFAGWGISKTGYEIYFKPILLIFMS